MLLNRVLEWDSSATIAAGRGQPSLMFLPPAHSPAPGISERKESPHLSMSLDATDHLPVPVKPVRAALKSR